MQGTVRNIPVFILAGGLGTRISDESITKPKPMIEIGGIPILIHIMRYYYAFGFNDFVICAGYRSWEIKEYFLNYESHIGHLVIDHRQTPRLPAASFGNTSIPERWRVRVLDTGDDCMTGGRIARALDILDPDATISDFAVTYGDGLSNVDLAEEFKFHKQHDRIGTVLGVRPLARFGELTLDEKYRVCAFAEKPQNQSGFINGGFFFFKRAFRSYLTSDSASILEQVPLMTIAKENQLMAFLHEGFWHPMDTPRDRLYLETLWSEGKAPWIERRRASKERLNRDMPLDF